MVETDPLCIMDFYVHESCQRQGVGLRLFRMVLEVRLTHHP
jgi:GNAT superfamily N-acetyltransferase